MSPSSETTSESRGRHPLCNPPIPTNLRPHLCVPHHLHHHHQIHHPIYNPHFHPCFHISRAFRPPTSSSHTATAEPQCSSGLPQPTAPMSFTLTNSLPHFHHHYHGCLAFCQRVPYHPCRRLLLPPSPCGFNFLHGQQHQNHEVNAYEDGDCALGRLQEVEDEAGDEEPVFVMTDEWLEFFAKSEAKRQQDKKLKQKKVGHQQKRKGSN
ncbi:uncharacterized protein LOC116249685 [Nymphaea colorata]|uniref:uncharacterized protein LOC116249685 n=1 Tax=Nymphaea colorata TaxID=210225 RepID=UPI00129EAFAC|nr:uncharacterized protein LOC116249685 [Nymphaea colorata]